MNRRTFVPGYDLVVIRIPGGSGGEYLFEDYLWRADAVVFTN